MHEQIRNMDVKKDLDIKIDTTAVLQQRRLPVRYFGHISRMGPDRYPYVLWRFFYTAKFMALDQLADQEKMVCQYSRRLRWHGYNDHRSNAMDSKASTVEMYHQHHGPPTSVDMVFVATAISPVSQIRFITTVWLLRDLVSWPKHWGYRRRPNYSSHRNYFRKNCWLSFDNIYQRTD